MISILPSPFIEVWLVDFEFVATPGNQQIPVCLVAYELRSERLIRIWHDELKKMKCPPYSIGRDALFVAYYASAEFGCHLSLGWRLPYHVLDLFTEFRSLTNGCRLQCGNGLLGALAWYGLGSIEAAEKDSMRDLILRGGPWNNKEKKSILDYCESDVLSLKKLLKVMDPHLDLSHALLRGEYMKAAAWMEYRGVPTDTNKLDQLKEHWEQIQLRLIQDIDSQYNIFENRTFKEKRFAYFLNSRKIPWPKLDSGKLDFKDETFKEMALTYPELDVYYQPSGQEQDATSQVIANSYLARQCGYVL
jgi:hypothetical protein